MKLSFFLWALKVVAPVVADILIASGKESLIKAGNAIKEALEILTGLTGKELKQIKVEVNKRLK